VVIVGVLAVRAVSQYVGDELLGDTWLTAERLIWPAGVAILGNALIVGPWLGLRVLAAARASQLCRWVGSVVQFVVAALLAIATRDIVVVAWGIGASVLLSAVWWAFAFRSANSQARRELGKVTA
jgi:hypothetical protein